ncbi:MAG TPA: ergothioneine biosynthesis glutamate--cysteine ligase EgtA [Acidimicrobiia bacterium]|nr:ergothioneine biosynthesis glutamate--cysteine ligase EgtA [Acidimicrobiia bacterium]
MPSPEPVLTELEAHRAVADAARGPAAPASNGTHRVGVELEWLAGRLDDPSRPVPFDALQAATASLEPLSGGSRISFEPGGQVELSSPALDGLAACTSIGRDTATLRAALEPAGIGLTAVGLDPSGERDRVVRNARYDAMEAFFDADGDAGRTMMRSTAAVQVNLDYGPDGERERRWQLAHDVGPVLAAAFANSPWSRGEPTGWRSARLAVWFGIDPGRSAPVPRTGACPDAWATYALDARVMMVRRSTDEHVPVLDDLGFRTWITDGHPLGWPTRDDLDYHLTTLFPPVRPRGWLELRMIDALPDPWWRAAVAVSDAVITDPELDAAVRAASGPVSSLWREAAHDGLSHPALGRAARGCFHAARDVLSSRGADRATIDATEEFIDRYVDRSRCPADDRLGAERNGATQNALGARVPAWT